MSNSIKREQHDEVVTLTFDQENSVANVFNEDMFAELNDQKIEKKRNRKKKKLEHQEKWKD